jgi:hypothetical protein
MRRLFTTAGSGRTRSQLAWGERGGRWRRVQRGIYAEGPDPVSPLDLARGRVLASGGPARGGLAGLLHRLDAAELDERPTSRKALVSHRVVVIDGVPCVDALQTLVDLAATLDDDRWEQALESALRRRLTSVAELDAVPAGTSGVPRIRRVLARRPPGAPPTESLLETLALQLARTVPGLGEPVRQYRVVLPDGTFVARLDLCWPPRGFFLELDGQHHAGQPVHDARRETAVVAATGWLPGRFTWHEVTRIPRQTVRRLTALAAQARRRVA